MPLYRVGQIWYVDLATSRGRHRRSSGTSDKRQAQAFHDRLKAEIWRQEKLGERPPVTWGEAVRKWVEVKNPGMPDRYRLRRLEIPLGMPLPIGTTLIQQCNHGLSPGSWNRLAALIRSIHLVSGSIPPTLDRKTNPPGRTRWLSREEWSRLQKALFKESPLLEQAARFTLATGLRENNVLELEWSQVDLKRRTAFLHADQVKNRQALGVPLNNDAMAVLVERRGKHKQYVFAHPDSGKPLVKASNRAWYEALRKAKLYKTGVCWHSLRHTWASWAVMNGVSLLELQRLGGWKSFQMVQRYAHLSVDHLAEAASKVKPISRK